VSLEFWVPSLTLDVHHPRFMTIRDLSILDLRFRVSTTQAASGSAGTHDPERSAVISDQQITWIRP
jgi:hypothetical protein